MERVKEVLTVMVDATDAALDSLYYAVKFVEVKLLIAASRGCLSAAKAFASKAKKVTYEEGRHYEGVRDLR